MIQRESVTTSKMNIIGLENIFRISTVLISLAVVLAPILYPKYSLYTNRATTGLQRLDNVRVKRDGVRFAYIEQGEKGFSELLEAICVVFGDIAGVERICFAIGSPPDLGEFTGLGMEYGIGDNGVLYVEKEDGSRELLRWEPWSPITSLEKEKLERGITLRAQERSHFITMALAVLWTTLSIVTVI
ncbi:hypothetical protein [Halorubrum halodurans]|uniref:hypothetical protein n=1 Tax=Halorubrum halodurans TaxID=1383851 RepID=UPI0011798D2D|nr:hypothetical protein [Halorubrum halodurans]